MQNKQDNHKQVDSLINDDDFVELMEARFQQSLSHNNEVNKHIVWKKLKKQISQTQFKQKWLPFASVAMLIIAILPTIFLAPQDSTMREKGESTLQDPIIDVRKLSTLGKLIPLPESPNSNDTLILKAKLASEGVVALILEKNNNMANVRFISDKLTAGDSLVLKRKKRTYGYTIEPTDRRLRFCLLSASNYNLLKIKINQLNKHLALINKNACRLIEINQPQ